MTADGVAAPEGIAAMAFAARLVDHHSHGVVAQDLSRLDFEDLITESSWPAGAGRTVFDSQVGLGVRWHCAPVLGLPPGVSPARYLARRAELGADEVNRRLLMAAGVDALLVETGYLGDGVLGVAEMGELAGARGYEVVRLETVAEQLMSSGIGSREFVDAYPAALQAATETAVGLKSIIAYRHGLDFDPARPSAAEVVDAVRAWHIRDERAGRWRVDDPVLLRHLIWAGVDRGLPLQFHVGFGDADVDLHRCNPLLMTAWLRATRELVPAVLLLHTYPFHREAGYLAHVYPHVYADVGLALNYTGARSVAVLAESLELTPFHKALYSSDAFGASELFFLGAHWFRRGMAQALGEWVARGDAGPGDAERIIRMVGADNARSVYGLPAWST